VIEHLRCSVFLARDSVGRASSQICCLFGSDDLRLSNLLLVDLARPYRAQSCHVFEFGNLLIGLLGVQAFLGVYLLHQNSYCLEIQTQQTVSGRVGSVLC